MKTLAIISIVLVALRAHTQAQAQVDCQRPPNFMETKDCCRIPEPQLSAYSQCQTQLSGPKNPCMFDCIFTEAQVLQGNDLNMDNVRTMLTRLFDGNQDFIQAYALGFERCAPIVKQKLENKNSTGGRWGGAEGGAFGGQKCSKIPLMYSMCAHKNVVTDCPATAWTSTPACEQAKQFLSSCEMPGFGRGGGNGGGGRFGRRNMSGSGGAGNGAGNSNGGGGRGGRMQRPNGSGGNANQ